MFVRRRSRERIVKSRSVSTQIRARQIVVMATANVLPLAISPCVNVLVTSQAPLAISACLASMVFHAIPTSRQYALMIATLMVYVLMLLALTPPCVIA